MTNTDPWEPLMSEYGFTAEELRDAEPATPYRCDCGTMIIRIGDIPEEVDEDGDGMGIEHDCEHSDDIPDTGEDIDAEPAPTRGDDLRDMLARIDALVPNEPDHTSEPTEADGVPAPSETPRPTRRSTPRSWDNVPETDDAPASPRRGNTSHAGCSHPATKAARAKCRRDRARG